jgi:hypothetical protein
MLPGALVALVCGCKATATGTICPSSQQATGLQVCADYNGYTAALAEATVACTGTIGPESFDASTGVLRRTFDQCVGPQPKALLQDVDNLLILQKLPGQDPLRQCYVEPWKAWRQKFLESGNRACPAWKNVGPVPDTVPNEKNLTSITNALPALHHPQTVPRGQTVPIPPATKTDVKFGKENFFYTVSFNNLQATQPCGNAQSCAIECAAGLAGFYQSSDGDRIVGDALWWWDPNIYSPDPYLQSGYYHPMSYYGLPPGARFGHPNRVGESCSYWDGLQHVPATLCGPTCAVPPDVGCTSLCMVGPCSL